MSRAIDEHIDGLTRGALEALIMHPRTPSFRAVPRAEISARIEALYRNLAAWVGARDDDKVRAAYEDWGRTRFAQRIPISEVVYTVILAKEHLHRYAREHAVDLREIEGAIGDFFDRALYYVVRGYEMQAATPAR